MEYVLEEKQARMEKPVKIHLCEEVIVGREANYPLRAFIRVSRKHAVFQITKGKLFIRDLGSLNGLYINLKKVGSEGCEVKVGDQIGFGSPDVRADNKTFICILKVESKDDHLSKKEECKGGDDYSRKEEESKDKGHSSEKDESKDRNDYSNMELNAGDNYSNKEESEDRENYSCMEMELKEGHDLSNNEEELKDVVDFLKDVVDCLIMNVDKV